MLATPTTVIDTRWSFTSGGACSRTVITTLLDVGRESTEVRACTYTMSAGSISIVFQGSTFVSTFPVAFASGDLLLGSFRFRRIG